MVGGEGVGSCVSGLGLAAADVAAGCTEPKVESGAALLALICLGLRDLGWDVRAHISGRREGSNELHA